MSYFRFHLGGTGPDGTCVLFRSSLDEMRSNPGPGGTLDVELDGIGVTFQLRPSAEGVRIRPTRWRRARTAQRVPVRPDRNFGLALLTNSEDGPTL